MLALVLIPMALEDALVIFAAAVARLTRLVIHLLPHSPLTDSIAHADLMCGVLFLNSMTRLSELAQMKIDLLERECRAAVAQTRSLW